MKQVNPADLLFLDECGVNLAMTALYAWAQRGERAVGSAPKNWGDNITLAGVLGLEGIVAPLMLRGSMDGEAFVGYIEQFVAPALRPGHVLLMDNLNVHKSVAVREAIEARGAKLIFLPPYSPDLSPIERAWSKIKTLVRKAAARGWDEMVDVVADAMRAVCSADALGWFRYSGYTIQPT
jgi:transposase